MKLKHVSLLIICYFALASRANADLSDAYVCLAFKSAGFGQVSYGNWTAREFDVNLEQHILRPKDARYEWVKTGESSGLSCSAFDQSGILSCSYGYGSIHFNKKNLRYIETYLLGYIEGDNKKATPSLTIGECVKM